MEVIREQRQPAPDKFVASFRCESDGMVGSTDAPIHSVVVHDDGVIEVVIDYWPEQAAEIEALRAEVETWRTYARGKHGLWQESVSHAERLAEALRKLEEREQSDTALLRKALEALEFVRSIDSLGMVTDGTAKKAIAALRERLGEKP